MNLQSWMVHEIQNNKMKYFQVVSHVEMEWNSNTFGTGSVSIIGDGCDFWWFQNIQNLLSLDMADLNENASLPLTYCESLKSYVLAVSTMKII
jgi:hypothetical protein